MPANVEIMFYVREKPWHGLGTRIEEAPTSADALVYAGLDWEVVQKDVYTGDSTLISGYKVNTRSTDNAALGIVSDRYKVVQNSDAFQFTDDLLGAGAEAEKELVGIILDYTTPRAYWDTPDPVEGTPPVCMSRDSLISQDGKACTRCPFNDFGSKDGESNAKACKESVLLYLLRPKSIMPLLVRIPVTSKPRFLRYMTRLVGTLTPLNGVVTRITLEKATSKQGKPYALFNFEAVSVLSPDEAAHARAFAEQFMEIVDAADMELDMSEAS